MCDIQNYIENRHSRFVQTHEAGMNSDIKLLDTVVLLEDIPDQNLERGLTGTVVEILSDDVVEVEFTDASGRTFRLLPVRKAQLLAVHDVPAGAERKI